MKLLSCAVAACLSMAALGASAADPTEKDAIAMVERGAAVIKSKGKDEMMKLINAKDASFVQGGVDVFVDFPTSDADN